MKRRGQGEGSIRERPNGRWEARYRGSDGRPRSIYAETRREAVERLRTALTEREQGIRPANQRITVSTFLADWLEHSVRPRCRPATVASYETMIRLYLEPELGRLPLAKLGPEHIQAMLARLSARPNLSPTSVRYVYAVLRIALGRAAKQAKVIRNVATLVDPPRKSAREVRPLTIAQIRHFLGSVSGDRFEALYVAAIGTGMRQGELLGLRWVDVNLDAGTVRVEHSLQRGTRTLAAPKTQRGRRTLQLAAFVTNALREHRRRQMVEQGDAWSLSGYVFATAKGTPLDTRNVTRYFQLALERAGLPHQRFHDLRHAAATVLIEQGVDLSIVSRMLGHADLSTTADVYAHLTNRMLQTAADQMEAAFSSQAVAAG